MHTGTKKEKEKERKKKSVIVLCPKHSGALFCLIQRM